MKPGNLRSRCQIRRMLSAEVIVPHCPSTDEDVKKHDPSNGERAFFMLRNLKTFMEKVS